MDICIRKETPDDYAIISEIVESAFRNEPHSDHQEQYLIERLRRAPEFLEDLALVATTAEGRVIGYILLTPITIGGVHPTLALAPVAVDPHYQHMGVGSVLVNSSHAKAKELGFESVILLGHPEYYPRFGYKELSPFGITMPFDVPDEYCMGIELSKGALSDKQGTIVYTSAFGLE
ncbi:MAG: GNAT family N-acetyltransferase [Bacteroidales bacterium]